MVDTNKEIVRHILHDELNMSKVWAKNVDFFSMTRKQTVIDPLEGHPHLQKRVEKV